MLVLRAWDWIRSRLYRLWGDAHRHFGNLYGNQEEHWAAIEKYTRATELDPAYAQAFFSRGVLHWREIGNFHRAIEDLSRVLDLAPDWADAYFNRGLAHRLRNEPERAIADFERYLATGKDGIWLESARRQLAELLSERAEEPVQQGSETGS